jgi:2-keto-4-pentenoate hydratase/2-oxohepta-3-ene-1,7-dioic acid hydratase in catechol pathway
MASMRLAHLRRDGALRLVVATTDDGWTDVATALRDDRASTFSGLLAAGDETIAAVRALGATGTPEPADIAGLGPVLDAPGRIFCVGRNYVEHRDEFASAPSDWPEVFLRLGSTVIGPADPIQRPSVAGRVDYEGEVAVVIGRGGRHIDPADALDHVFAVTAANDVSVRDWQRRGGQWTPGKNFDATLPIGPTLVTTDELDPTDVELTTLVNGQQRQHARTTQFIFDLPTQIGFISSWTTLQPGDLICTGTPGGVGDARTPPLLLSDGDLVEVTVQGVGTLRNRVVDDGLAPVSGHWRDVAAQA